jgi:ATP adenylyltransferase
VSEDHRPLWAPWRHEYVGGGAPGCIFCDRPADGSAGAPPRSDRERLILARGPRAMVLLNRFPYASAHLMVAPYRHIGRLEALDRDELLEIMEHAQRAAAVLTATYRCDGYNLGVNVGTAAGAGIADHVHLHVVPRWSGDVNFMTSIAGVRVMPSHLEKVFDDLAPQLEMATSAGAPTPAGGAA